MIQFQVRWADCEQEIADMSVYCVHINKQCVTLVIKLVHKKDLEKINKWYSTNVLSNALLTIILSTCQSVAMTQLSYFI